VVGGPLECGRLIETSSRDPTPAGNLQRVRLVVGDRAALLAGAQDERWGLDAGFVAEDGTQTLLWATPEATVRDLVDWLEDHNGMQMSADARPVAGARPSSAREMRVARLWTLLQVARARAPPTVIMSAEAAVVDGCHVLVPGAGILSLETTVDSIASGAHGRSCVQRTAAGQAGICLFYSWVVGAHVRFHMSDAKFSRDQSAPGALVQAASSSERHPTDHDHANRLMRRRPPQSISWSSLLSSSLLSTRPASVARSNLGALGSFSGHHSLSSSVPLPPTMLPSDLESSCPDPALAGVPPPSGSCSSMMPSDIESSCPDTGLACVPPLPGSCSST